MKKGPLLPMWGRRSGSMCIVPHLGPQRRALFSGPGANF